MVAIANYGELRAALSDHVDHRNISTVLPRLVQTAESMLNRELRTRFQITSATVTFVDGEVTLPADFLEMVHVFGLNGYQYRSGPLSDAQRWGSQFSRYSIGSAGMSIKGFSGDRQIEYFAALPTLTTSSVTTNWLLTRYPDVYLYAVGVEAAKYLKDATLLEISKQLLADAMRSLKVDDDRARWSNTTVRVQGATP
jgi:hypothetical protein